MLYETMRAEFLAHRVNRYGGGRLIDDKEEGALTVVQARMASTRLPGKTLRAMAGVPMLQRLLDRVARPQPERSIVVATSDKSSDDPVEELCARWRIPCVRGSADDVLGRFVKVLNLFDPRLVVRLTGDNPLVDARAVAAGIRAFWRCAESEDIAGVSNHLSDRSDPYGYCVEVFRPAALREVHESNPTREEREHVTLGFRRRARYSYESYALLPGDQSQLRWTVDTEEDFRYVERLFDELGPECTAEQAVEWSGTRVHGSASL